MAEPVTRPVKVPAAHQALWSRPIWGAGRAGAAAAIARPRFAQFPTYQLLATLAAAGFVVHLVDERRWCLGVAAYELGRATSGGPAGPGSHGCAGRLSTASGRARTSSCSTAQVIYVIEERAPGVVSGHRRRRAAAAQLHDSGRAMLAALPAARVRALFPGRSA
jgi:DNA-binding IclR family transcriptional regulator